MIKVLVAEDEPVSLKTICSIIEKNCCEYEITGQAENGEQALNFIRTDHPDLVISDIKMPKISGVELARRVREEFPDICFIIVSGYQDFAYMQSAIRSGVSDYLLKPLMPDALCRAMEFAAEKIRRIQYRARNRILANMVRNEAVEDDELKRYFPHAGYFGALVRTNGLPRRFQIDRKREIFSDIDEQYIVFGRDEMESLYLIPSEFMSHGEFVPYVEKIQKKHMAGGYYTLIYAEQSFDVTQIQEQVRRLYQLLDIKSTIGHTQVIGLEEAAAESNDFCTDCSALEESLQRIHLYAGSKKTDAVRKEIIQAYQHGERERRSQLWMEGVARDIISILRRQEMLSIPVNECEYMLGDIFSNAESVESLCQSLIDIFLDTEQEDQNQKAGSREYFDQIVKYLEFHIREPLSLQEICTTFAISQAYLSKLFRKYTAHSFNKYLTQMRIEKAKEYFIENPERYIREVAELVGYEDQFYFSRIFRTYTGKSPTEYTKELQSEGGVQ